MLKEQERELKEKSARKLKSPWTPSVQGSVSSICQPCPLQKVKSLKQKRIRIFSIDLIPRGFRVGSINEKAAKKSISNLKLV